MKDLMMFVWLGLTAGSVMSLYWATAENKTDVYLNHGGIAMAIVFALLAIAWRPF